MPRPVIAIATDKDLLKLLENTGVTLPIKKRRGVPGAVFLFTHILLLLLLIDLFLKIKS